ncbi:TPA: hypothetical protein U1364_001738 [Streptococcus suis]|uniref:hypothetical protein n=1 Tax=Streptococcus suis TaxID=1307 RepID=UPI0003F7E913|nr:hypothetical protein [Streptococcus suis]HEM3214323.1 hypothetical protein [Streptococcus suis 12814]HEM4253901.1 hypothetical protein [Streptococcus suis]HEM5199075.1 hypothetical protein [Streptococcus suis]HEM5313320.1 hypothetical protein [Streptococcus suis]
MTLLQLGLCESPKKLMKALASLTSIPTTIKVVDSSTGLLNEGSDKQRPWANLVGIDSQLFEKFESIGQEQHCPTFKIKLKGYRDEDLTSLIGKELTFQEYEVAFVFDKFKQPVGLALVLDLSDISVK